MYYSDFFSERLDVFLITQGLHSVAGSYEDLYVLVPEANLTGLRVEQYVRRALNEVQSVGFTVTALLADHHQTNQLFFRWENENDSRILHRCMQFVCFFAIK